MDVARYALSIGFLVYLKNSFSFLDYCFEKSTIAELCHD